MEVKFDLNSDQLPGLIVVGGLAISGFILFGKWCISKTKRHKEKMLMEYGIRHDYAVDLIRNALEYKLNDNYTDEETVIVSYLVNKVREYREDILWLVDHTNQNNYKDEMNEVAYQGHTLCLAITENNKIELKSYYDKFKSNDKRRDEDRRRNHELKLKQMELDAETEHNLRGVKLASTALYSLGRGLKNNE